MKLLKKYVLSVNQKCALLSTIINNTDTLLNKIGSTLLKNIILLISIIKNTQKYEQFHQCLYGILLSYFQS